MGDVRKAQTTPSLGRVPAAAPCMSVSHDAALYNFTRTESITLQLCDQSSWTLPYLYVCNFKVEDVDVTSRIQLMLNVRN